MSKRDSLEEIIPLKKIESEKIKDGPNFFCGPKLINPDLFKLYFSQKSILGSINKNGLLDRKTRDQTISFNPNENKSKDSSFQLRNINYGYYKFLPIYNKNNNISQNEQEKAKILKLNKDKFKDLEDFSKNPDSQSHFYTKNKDIKVYNEILPHYPLISSLFLNNNYKTNNNNNRQKFNYIEKEKYNKYKSKSCEPKDLKSSSGKKATIVNNINFQIKDNNEKEIHLRNSDNNTNNKNFENDFINNYKIKEINIRKNNTLKNDIPSHIKLKDMLNFMNNLFENINNNNINNDNNNNNNNKNNNNKNGSKKIMQEFIEYFKLDSNEQKEITFLQKKRKINDDIDEIDDIDDEFNKNNMKPLNNRNKNKINNKKDGKKICIYLNQFRVNKSNLEIFPFFPSLINKENIKIKFLKGIIRKKFLIRINRKTQLIKDKRNLEFITNKSFNIIYQGNNLNNYIILNINGFHILYLILYYYHKIQEGIQEINKLHYSHKSFEEIKVPIKLVEKLIKQTNKLVKNITL